MNNYDIPVFRTLVDSFKKIKGAWKPLLGAAFLMFLLQFTLVELPQNMIANSGNMWLSIAALCVSIFIMLPLNAGLWMLGVEWVGTKQVKMRDIFHYWHLRYIGKLLLLMLWFVVRVGLPILVVFFCLMIAGAFGFGYEKFLQLLSSPEIFWLLLSGIPWWTMIAISILLAITLAYLIFPYLFAVPLAFTKTISVWQAITMAGKGFRKHGLKIILLFFIQSVVMAVCLLPVYLPLTFVAWSVNSVFLWGVTTILSGLIGVLLMPWYVTLFGVIYHKMFSEVADVRS